MVLLIVLINLYNVLGEPIRTGFPSVEFGCKENKECPLNGWTVKSIPNFHPTDYRNILVSKRPFEMLPFSKTLLLKYDIDLAQFKPTTEDTTKTSLWKWITGNVNEGMLGKDILVALCPSDKPLKEQNVFYLFRFNWQKKDSKLYNCQNGAKTEVKLVDQSGDEVAKKCKEVVRFNVPNKFTELKIELNGSEVCVWQNFSTLSDPPLMKYKDPNTSRPQFNFFTSATYGEVTGLIMRTFQKGKEDASLYTSPFFVDNHSAICVHLEADSKSPEAWITGEVTTSSTQKIWLTQYLKDTENKVSLVMDLPENLRTTPINFFLQVFPVDGHQLNVMKIAVCSENSTVVEYERSNSTELIAQENTQKKVSTEETHEIIHSGFEELAGKFPGSVIIRWSVDLEGGQSMEHLIQYQCLKRLGCNEECPPEVQEVKVWTPSVTLTNLLPYTRYLVVVSVANRSSSHIKVETMEEGPTEIPLPSNRTQIRYHNAVTIHWTPVSVCSGQFKRYRFYHYYANDLNQVLSRGETTEPAVTLHNIHPHKLYVVRVYIETTAGWNKDRYLEINIPANGTMRRSGFFGYPRSKASLLLTTNLVKFFSVIYIVTFLVGMMDF